MSINKQEVIGKKFNNLTVESLHHIHPITYHKYYKCVCDCGNSSIVNIYKLNSGHTKSCGCRRLNSLSKYNPTTHGKYNTTIYRVWIRMKSRCLNPNDKAYEWYGRRGITVSDEWLSFNNFYRDMGDKPTPQHSLDRIDNNLGYSKENCRWATMMEQGNNRRSNVNITFNGRTQTISEWAREIGIHHSSLVKRLKKWSLKEALTTKKYEV